MKPREVSFEQSVGTISDVQRRAGIWDMMGNLNTEILVKAVETLIEVQAEHRRRDQALLQPGPHSTTAAPSPRHCVINFPWWLVLFVS